MQPGVEAAIIAGGVGVVTVIATVLTQLRISRRTSESTEMTLRQQSVQLDATLVAQRDQLATTLKAQSQQLERTLGEQRTRTLNERFATAAGQLGSDKPAAVRLAGVYAMAGLADDWEENRQTCVDVLCGYLRMPYEADPGDEAPEPVRLAFEASRQVRHTVIRVITAHLRDGAAVSWQGLDFDFMGVVFDGGNFVGANFSGGEVNFIGAEFSSGDVHFVNTKFSGGVVTFSYAKFSGSEVIFQDAEFSGGIVYFVNTKFSGGTVNFYRAEFSGGTVGLYDALFSGGEVFFCDADFSGGTVGFDGARFSGSRVSFADAEFRTDTGNFRFPGARFSGGTVDFSKVRDWSVPPRFGWKGTPPPGVTLPPKEDQSKSEP